MKFYWFLNSFLLSLTTHNKKTAHNQNKNKHIKNKETGEGTEQAVEGKDKTGTHHRRMQPSTSGRTSNRSHSLSLPPLSLLVCFLTHLCVFGLLSLTHALTNLLHTLFFLMNPNPQISIYSNFNFMLLIFQFPKFQFLGKLSQF
jgi:Flp pilus assembly protein TadB